MHQRRAQYSLDESFNHQYLPFPTTLIIPFNYGIGWSMFPGERTAAVNGVAMAADGVGTRGQMAVRGQIF